MGTILEFKPSADSADRTRRNKLARVRRKLRALDYLLLSHVEVAKMKLLPQ